MSADRPQWGVVRISADLDARLKLLKAKEGVSKHFVAEQAIRQWLDREKPKNGRRKGK